MTSIKPTCGFVLLFIQSKRGHKNVTLNMETFNIEKEKMGDDEEMVKSRIFLYVTDQNKIEESFKIKSLNSYLISQKEHDGFYGKYVAYRKSLCT